MSSVTETGGSFFDRRDAKMGLIASAVVLAFLVIMGIVHRHWNEFDLSDPRNVLLVQTATLEPDKDSHRDGDDVAGLRPGQSAEVASSVFKDVVGSHPNDEQASMTLGDMRSQRFVNEFWDIGVEDDLMATYRVMLSSPSTGNVVLSALRDVEYEGFTGYPNVADIEAALVARYGPPTSRGNFASSQDIYMTWVRGGGECDAFECRYPSYSNPPNDDAETLSGKGIPLRPIIAARIVVRSNANKALRVAVRMTDYQMLAASVAADDAALGKAQAEFEKLIGPEIKF